MTMLVLFDLVRGMIDSNIIQTTQQSALVLVVVT